MLKQLAAFILLFAFTFQCFSRAFIVIDYYTNTQRYAKNCENKNRPILHCSGKCQMKNKLSQEEKKDQQNPDRKENTKKDNTLSSKHFFASIAVKNAILKLAYYPYCSKNAIEMPRSVFHPPNC